MFVAGILYIAGEEVPPLPSTREGKEEETVEKTSPLRERVVLVQGLTIVGTHGENAAPHRSAPTLIARTSSLENETLEERKKALLQSTLTIRIPSLLGLPEQSFPIPLSEHPAWVILEESEEGKRIAIDVENVTLFLEEFLETEVVPFLPAPSQARLTTLPSEDETHAEVRGRARDGWVLRDTAARAIAHALREGRLTVTIPLDYIQGTVIPEAELGVGPMVLLARGRSNFSGSVPNRAYNVRKALNEHVNGVLLAPGAAFSFHRLFPKPISSAAGWKMAMGIFDGSRLEATPGGGICQSSTTLYRAVLLAGLPILQHFSHSMYIKLYSEHGEGLDSTYYPGSKDLKFLNDTGTPLLIQAYDENDEAIVEIYGTPDGRTVTLEGPYRASDAPEELTTQLGRTLYASEIAWLYRITQNDGTTHEQVLHARYTNDIPAEPPPSPAL